jgi:CubicO group peptidase (beta-lactamase class C family)
MPRRSARRVIPLCILLVHVPRVCDAQLGGADFDRVDRYVEAQLQEANIPGAAIAIVRSDGVLHARGFGVAGPGQAPVTVNTPFVIGSVSKSITALAIMKLVEARRIALDAPVRQYLSWFRVLPHEQARAITIRHLLTHTSGLSHAESHLDRRDDSDTALERRVRELAGARLANVPGERFQYSNVNYQVAGAIIEAVSGQQYELYIEQHVFAPLHMTQSFASFAAAREHGLAQGHRYWFGRPVASQWVPPRHATAAGFLVSSAADLSRLLRMYLNGGVADGGRFLSSESITTLQRPAVSVGANQYALGWRVRNVEGRRVVEHGGEAPDFVALMSVIPDEGWGVAFLVNAQSHVSGPDVGALRFQVRRLLMGLTTQPIREGTGLFTPILLGLGLLLILQLLAAIHTLFLIRQWRRDPARRPQGRSRFLRHAVLPPLASIALVLLLMVIPRVVNNVSFFDVRIFAPDAGLLMFINLALACLWTPVRTIVVLRALDPGISLTRDGARHASASAGMR